MQQILSAQAQDGMILAKDVEIEGGRILCGKGTTLTTSLIERLIRMEIYNITVEGHPVSVAGEKTLKEELQDMEDRFSRVKDVPPLMYLKKRLMQKLIASRSE
jgi:hypothetical protein